MKTVELLRLAAFLESIPEEAPFSLREWTTARSWDIKPFNGQFTCGFAGCAIGWAAHANIIPGLRLYGSPKFYPRASRPNQYYSGWDAVEHAFELGDEQAKQLFMYSRYVREEDEGNVPEPTARDVASRIRALVSTQLAMG